MGLRFLLPAAFLGALVFAQSASVEFNTLDRAVIEGRLGRAAGSNAEHKARLQELLGEVGCTGEHFREQKVSGSRLPNLVCTMPGQNHAVIIVGAHYDAVDLGKGAVDNWSGASLLPSLVESLGTVPRRHTFVFVGFSGEERGLAGSDSYVRELTREEKSRTRAMVNLDCLGLSPTKVWVNGSNRKLTAMLAGVAKAMKLPLEGANVDTDDSQSFARRKIPSISIHSLTQETLRILHSVRDNLDAIRGGDYYDTYRLVAAYLAYLDTALE
jgi:hypothetical protein